MIRIKYYLYDSEQEANGYRGEGLSENILQGTENVEDLTSERDTTQITLMGISRRENFAPGTMFIIDITSEYETMVEGVLTTVVDYTETLHRVCQNDYVTQPILEDDTYFKHQISLIEPSALMQKRITDNMAITYKVKDVTLSTQITYPIQTAKIGFNPLDGKFTPPRDFGIHPNFLGFKRSQGKYLQYIGKPKIVKANGAESDLYYYNITDLDYSGTYKIKVKIPPLRLYSGVYDTQDFTDRDGSTLYNVSTKYKITEKNLDGTPTGIVYEGNIIERTDFSAISYAQTSGSEELQKTYVPDFIEPFYSSSTLLWRSGMRKFSSLDASISVPYHGDTPTEIGYFNVSSGKRYDIDIGVYTFTDPYPAPEEPLWFQADNTAIRSYSYGNENIFGVLSGYGNDMLNPNTYTYTFSIQTYSNSNAQAVFTSGNPYSALMLIEKAVMNSGLYKKSPDVPTGLLNYRSSEKYSYDAPIYIDPAYIEELSKTTVIENFYNQKNLWEIFLEVGNYIHAVPEIKFGENNKFLLTFNKLGETKETSGSSTKMTITNFRGIDDYICATSSYISNLVQLGGQIQETVAPKSSDENYIVSNDNAEIIVSKKILEVLKFEVISNIDYTFNYRTEKNGELLTKTIHVGDVSDAKYTTSFIYEENIYKILSINYADNPNKGICLYYSLGDNKIVGCNYQLPQESPNIYSDYTLKKLIFLAYVKYYPTNESLLDEESDFWKEIKVNDFQFRVTYRTQDEARQIHSRPDLRKYLLSSKFDAVPQYQQFNNQTDVVIDSQKFGSNIYGSLIRTGNTNYIMREWVENPSQLKKKGEIYRINGEIYYVAKSTNTYYSDYIISIVEYSKDYNQLSKVIGIPSEPRFYEISEQNYIKREKLIDDYLLVTTDGSLTKVDDDNSMKNMNEIARLIVGDNNLPAQFPQYAMTVFKGDQNVDYMAETFGDPTLYTEIISPISAYLSGNTLTYEWDMADNFSAGDRNVEPSATLPANAIDSAYYSLQATNYTDKYGKATLFDFYIINSAPLNGFTAAEVRNFPLSPYTADTSNYPNKRYVFYQTIIATNQWQALSADYDDIRHNTGLALIKDSREQISFNYNLQCISSSDQFVFSPFLFEPNKPHCKLILLSEEVNKLSNGYFNRGSIIYIDGEALYDFNEFVHVYHPGANTSIVDRLTIPVSDALYLATQQSEFSNVKAIAMIYEFDLQQDKIKFVLARNIPSNTAIEDITADWVFGTPNKDLLFSKQ